jgi:hypothetical protein
LHDPVVLLVERPARGEVGRGQQGEERVAHRCVGSELPRRRRVERGGRALRREVVDRAVVDERRDRHVADELVAVEDPHPPRGGDLANGRAVDLPPAAHGQHVVEPLRRADAQHPLLRLGDHDLEGLHVGLAQRHAADVEVDADAALGGHLGRRRGQPGGPEVLEGDEQAALEQFERALHELLAGERIADLDGGALVTVGVAELGAGQHRRAADAVAPGRGAEEHDDVAHAGRRGADHALVRRQPEGHRVDEAVVLVRGLEVDLAADRRHADRVAVVADAGDGVVEQVARALRALGLAEAQRVEHRDRPRAEGEDVAQDAAHAGGGALEGLDRARVVVRLDLEGADQPAADVDGAGVLAGAHDDVAALGRQRPQQPLGVLVGAVLAPQQREHGELDPIGRALELVEDQGVLGAREAEGDGVLDAGQRRRLRHTQPRASRSAGTGRPGPPTRRAAGRRPSRPAARRPRARGGA